MARFGGDELGLVLPGRDAAGAAAALADVSRALQAPCLVEGRWLPLSGSIGVAAAPEHGSTMEELMRHALADLASLQDHVGVAVNVSPSTLRDAGFCDRMLEMLDAAGQPPRRLLLEMTESALVDELDAVRCTLERLAAAGIALSLDDFGQGSTSLAFLGALPSTEITLDRAFVADLDVSRLSRTIVAAVVSIAHETGMRVVAEGIEDEVVLQRVRDLGCDVAQGYHLARPGPLPRRRRAAAPVEAPVTAPTALAAAGAS